MGNVGNQGVYKGEENLGLEVECQVEMRPGRWRRLEPGSDVALSEKSKASVRAKVEHFFLKVKRLFGYVKVRCRGLARNTERLALLFGLCNLLTAERQLRGWWAGAVSDRPSGWGLLPAAPSEGRKARDSAPASQVGTGDYVRLPLGQTQFGL